MQFIQTTVKAVTEISPFPLSVSDAHGYIIGDSNPDRISTFHQPSSEVLKHNRPQIFHKDRLTKLDNVLPGVALPLQFDSETKGVLGIIGDPKEVLPYAQLIKRHVEVIWQDTIRSKIEELETTLFDAFIQYILLGDVFDQAKTDRYCEMLQINQSLKRYCILIDIGDHLLNHVRKTSQFTKVAHFRKTLLDTVSHVFSNQPDDLCAFLNTEKITLIKSVSTKEEYKKQMQQFDELGKKLLQMLKGLGITNVSIAAGGLCETLEDMNTSFQEAKNLIRHGRSFHIQPEVYSFHQWDTLKALLPYEIDQPFLEKLQFRLEPLRQDKQFHELANSFIVYCQNNLNLTKAAKNLFLHRNTLIYRLKKIEQATELDLGSFTDCVVLYLSLERRNSA